MSSRIQIRRDTALNWSNANPILAEGEPALEVDTLKEKLGDGLTNWNGLPYKSSGLDAAGVTEILEKWVKVTGTLEDNDLKVVIGSHDDSGDGLKITLDESTNTVLLPGFKCFYDADYGSYIATIGDTEGIYAGNTLVMDDYSGITILNHGIDIQGSADVRDFFTLRDSSNGNSGMTFRIIGNLPNGAAAINVRGITGTLPVLVESDNTNLIPTPTSSGVMGEVRIIQGFRYDCRAADTWVRTAIDTTW